MKWFKLNKTFDAEPNSPIPRVVSRGDVVQLRFFLNPFIWKDVDEEEKALLTFQGVLMYRLGSTNDEGFYRGQCRFSKSGIEWGNFYELFESNWQATFPLDRTVISPIPISNSKLKHYLFYFRDETFECIAENFEYQRLAKSVSSD